MSDSNSYVVSSNSNLPWYSERSSMKSVEIGQKIEPISTKYWFYMLSNMEKGNFANLDTSSVTNMGYMFNSAGSKATTWSVKISSKTGDLTNTTSKWHDSSESTYAEPPTGKYFTLA